MSNPNQSSQEISDDFVEIQPIAAEFEKIEPVPAKPTIDPEYVYWVSWRIPRVLFSKFVNSETDPITGDGGDGPLLKAIEEYEAAKHAKGKIPSSLNVAPPLPKDFDPAMSVPPTIGEGQSLPVYRVQCAVCRSINKGVDPPAHNCADYQL